MDLRSFYREIRQAESQIATEDVVVVSLATPDGGKAGVRTEVPRAVAARMLVEKRARLATEEEAAAFRLEEAEARRLVEQAEAAKRVQVTVIPEAEMRALRSARTKQ
jgi:hypothetical protein